MNHETLDSVHVSKGICICPLFSLVLTAMAGQDDTFFQAGVSHDDVLSNSHNGSSWSNRGTCLLFGGLTGWAEVHLLFETSTCSRLLQIWSKLLVVNALKVRKILGNGFFFKLVRHVCSLAKPVGIFLFRKGIPVKLKLLRKRTGFKPVWLDPVTL